MLFFGLLSFFESICTSFHLCLLFSSIFWLYLFDSPVAYCADDSLDLELSEAGPPGGRSGELVPRSLAENEAALYRQWWPLAAQEPAPAGAAHTAHPLPAGGQSRAALALLWAAEAATGDSPK